MRVCGNSYSPSDSGDATGAVAALAASADHPLLELMTALTDFTRRSAGLVGSLVASGLVLFLLQRLLTATTVRLGCVWRGHPPPTLRSHARG